MWSICRLVIASSLCISLFAADSNESPWEDEWSMTLKGVERWYVDHKEKSYLQVEQSDQEDLSFLIGKDVMIQAKFRQLEGTTVQFYSFPTLIIGTDTEEWSTIIDGDNVYILGKVAKFKDEQLVFKTKDVLRAPSDSMIIASKLAEIGESNYAERVTYSKWVRKTGKNMGNRAVWIAAADNIVDDCINAVAKQAKSQRDIDLLLKAMNWSTDELSDKSRAAKLGSQDWVSELNEVATQKLVERMGILGLTQHEGKWVTKQEQKILQFHKDLNAIKPGDDKAFLALSKEIGQYRDVLPEALELQHKALQTGLRLNPNSNLLREALGKKSVKEELESKGLLNNFKDDLTGLDLPVPEGWHRNQEAIDGDVTWIDPQSDTAYISLTVVRAAQSDNFLELFEKQLEPIKAKESFSASQPSVLSVGSASKEARFSFKEGREERNGIMSCVLFLKSETAFVVYCSYVPDESTVIQKAYQHVLDGLATIDAVDKEEKKDDKKETKKKTIEEVIIEADSEDIVIDDEAPIDTDSAR